jgi:epoxyqueuosine reductase
MGNEVEFKVPGVEWRLFAPVRSRLRLNGPEIQMRAAAAGFDLAGIALAAPHPDATNYHAWAAAGNAGEMRYLTDYRADRRSDPTSLLPTARSVICLGMLYNGPEPYSTRFDEPARAWISRYAWGEDYHHVLKRRLQALVDGLLEQQPFDYKICVDTAPLLERSYAREAGLGWIGKNTCLINQAKGSWYLLGEILTSLDLDPGQPAPDRCGTCTRCIDACPTAALSPAGLDARLCISYLTIELRGSIPEQLRAPMGRHVFGCDICQDVCPWNRKAPVNRELAFAPRHFAPPLEKLAALTESEFRELFRGSPVERARYRGFMRNVCVAMGNAPREEYRARLEQLACSPDAIIAEHARWALERLDKPPSGRHNASPTTPSHDQQRRKPEPVQ